jgi:DNA-binding IclR family transcriptional regulator
MPEIATARPLVEDESPRLARPPRPQPIRDAILRFLTEPRSASDIAEHIERPVPTATGHLGAMIRLGLVQRLAFGTYAAATYDGPKIRLPSRRSTSSKTLRRRLRALLHETSSVQGLRLKTSETETTVRLALRDLWLSGLVERDENDGYWLAGWQHRK